MPYDHEYDAAILHTFFKLAFDLLDYFVYFSTVVRSYSRSNFYS